MGYGTLGGHQTGQANIGMPDRVEVPMRPPAHFENLNDISNALSELGSRIGAMNEVAQKQAEKLYGPFPVSSQKDDGPTAPGQMAGISWQYGRVWDELERLQANLNMLTRL